MSEQRAMQRLCGLMRKAVQDYEMIAPGDRVMVGVSGGKDSVALTVGLSLLRKYIGFDYEVVAVTLDPQFDHQPMDYTALAELFAGGTASPTRSAAPRSAPWCSSTARKEPLRPVRQAAAGRAAHRRAGAGLQQGGAGASSGRCRGDLLHESLAGGPHRLLLAGHLPFPAGPDPHPSHAAGHRVRGAVRRAGGDLPIVKSRCPADGVTVREQTKEFVRERCRTDHAFRQKTLHALQESGIDGWRPVHTGRGSFSITNEEE